MEMISERLRFRHEGRMTGVHLYDRVTGVIAAEIFLIFERYRPVLRALNIGAGKAAPSIRRC
jgi:hypothetical protein